MSLTITQTKTALTPNTIAYFLGIGGTAPYTYSVTAGGAGGSINSSTGLYSAPASSSIDPNFFYDTVVVTDNLGATASGQILVGTPLQLFLEIIQTQLGLTSDHCFFYNQKEFQPTDASLGMWVAISVLQQKVFGNSNSYGSTGWNDSAQYVNVMSTLDVRIMSRDNSALLQGMLVPLALNSNYSQQQQEANSFLIGKVPTRISDLSGIDGAAIPYTFIFSVNLQYAVSLTQGVDYYDSFRTPMVITDQIDPYVENNEGQFTFDNEGDPIKRVS